VTAHQLLQLIPNDINRGFASFEVFPILDIEPGDMYLRILVN
jgi:hypothetical protein